MDLVQNSKSLDRDLKNISLQEFLNFGIRDVAYIRKIDIENKTAYAIHAADGTPLTIMETLDSALLAVRHNDLEAVTIQ